MIIPGREIIKACHLSWSWASHPMAKAHERKLRVELMLTLDLHESVKPVMFGTSGKETIFLGGRGGGGDPWIGR